MIARVGAWLAGFARFWYRFIVGDDWRSAFVVALAIALSGVLVRKGATVWWLLPAVVVTTLTVRLRLTRDRR